MSLLRSVILQSFAMELASHRASTKSQVLMNPLKTLVPVNASRRKVVDKHIELLVFSWKQRQHQRAILPAIDHSVHPTKETSSGTSTSGPQNQLTGALNSLTPFYSVVKPTCGFRFSWETNHRYHNTGILASNPVKWRTNMLSILKNKSG